MINRSRAYWICQIAGWGTYGLAMSGFYAYGEDSDLTFNRGFSILLLSLTGLGLTHTFRYIIKKYGWLNLSQVRLVFQVLAANLLMALIYSIINISSELSLNLIQVDNLSTGDLVLSAGILLINAAMLLLLWSVIYFAIAFFTRYRKEEIERLKWESSVKDFELKKLKSQLNPHFVFNALNGIRSLIDEDPAKAKQAVTQLSNLLRNSLLADRERTIPLDEELKTVNDYINLEKIRFEDRLQSTIEVEKGAGRVHVPPMMIQTLVENAVKHGISKSTTGGFINVYAAPDNGWLHISITNTGKLNVNGKSNDSSGFGILNTKQRIALLYGIDNGFSISQISENTVQATIKIPLK